MSEFQVTRLILAMVLSQNGVSVTNRTVDRAVAVRCVAPDGGGFESCGGNTTVNATSVSVSNLPATSVAPLSVRLSNGDTFYNASGGGGGASTQGFGIDGGQAWNVSGQVAITNFPGSQAVTGTFWPGTQPVSLAVAPTTPVTGPVTDTQLRASAVPVSLTSTTITGTAAVTQSGTWYTQEGASTRFSCVVQAATVMTQCQAAPAAGQRAYVTGMSMSNQAATVQTLDIVYGTGTNCATSPVALTHKVQMGTVATTTSPFWVAQSFTTPLVPVAANAICVRPSAATAFGATLTGYIAP